MQNRHLALVLLTLALGACGGDGSGSQPAIAPRTEPDAPAVSASSAAVPTTAAAPAASSPATVRTDDLEAELRAVDEELSAGQESVNRANDTSPDRADD
ncbi:MAG: hypothetical protein QOG87_4138 [Actinomycetota bacterium]|jgi:hypothetical protein